MKKRILSLVLTAATILTMTACGSNSEETNKPSSGNTNSLTTNSTESDATQPGDASVPEKEPFKFAGTWRRTQKTAEPEKEYLLIDSDGNLKWYNQFSDDSCDEYTFKYLSESDTSGYFNYKNGPFIYVTLVGNYYYLTIYDSYNNPSYYYREEDMVDCNVIDLTADNFAQYIETKHRITTEKDDFGDITTIYDWMDIGFKEGLGPASFILGEFKYNFFVKNATYNPETEVLVIGETTDSHEGAQAFQDKFWGLGDYEDDRGWSTKFQKNDDGTLLIEGLGFYEFTGAERIIGKVFVPKGWQG